MRLGGRGGRLEHCLSCTTLQAYCVYNGGGAAEPLGSNYFPSDIRQNVCSPE